MKITLMDGTVTHNKRTAEQIARLAPGIMFIATGVWSLIRRSEAHGMEQLATIFKENGITVNEPNK